MPPLCAAADIHLTTAGKPRFQEDIYRIGITKLRLDDAVGGTGTSSSLPGLAGDSTSSTPIGEGGVIDDSKAQSEVKKSLLNTLRQKLVDEKGKVKEVTEDALSGGEDVKREGEVVDEAGVVHIKVE